MKVENDEWSHYLNIGVWSWLWLSKKKRIWYLIGTQVIKWRINQWINKSPSIISSHYTGDSCIKPIAAFCWGQHCDFFQFVTLQWSRQTLSIREAERSKQSARRDCQTQGGEAGTTTGRQTGRAPPVPIFHRPQCFSFQLCFRSSPRHVRFHHTASWRPARGNSSKLWWNTPTPESWSMHERHESALSGGGDMLSAATWSVIQTAGRFRPLAQTRRRRLLPIGDILLFVPVRCANITACAVCGRSSLSTAQCYCGFYLNYKKNNFSPWPTLMAALRFPQGDDAFAQ